MLKNPPVNSGDIETRISPLVGKIPWRNRNSLQYSCLRNLMDRGAWQATVTGVQRIGHDLVTTSTPQ